MGMGHVRVLGAAWSLVGLGSDGRTVAGDFSGYFSGDFSGNIFMDRFAPNIKFSRLCGLVLVSSVF